MTCSTSEQNGDVTLNCVIHGHLKPSQYSLCLAVVIFASVKSLVTYCLQLGLGWILCLTPRLFERISMFHILLLWSSFFPHGISRWFCLSTLIFLYVLCSTTYILLLDLYTLYLFVLIFFILSVSLDNCVLHLLCFHFHIHCCIKRHFICVCFWGSTLSVFYSLGNYPCAWNCFLVVTSGTSACLLLQV